MNTETSLLLPQPDQKPIKHKKAKKQYSCGFKYQPKPKNFVEDCVLFIGQLNTQETRQKPQPTPKLTKEKIQSLNKRLSVPKQYTESYSHTEPLYSQPNIKFNQKYQLQPQYYDKGIQCLVTKQMYKAKHQLQKLHNNIKSLFQTKQQAILRFIFDKSLLNGKQSLPNHELYIVFKNYLLNSHKKSNPQITYQQLSKICHQNIYLYCFCRFQQISKDSKVIQFKKLLEQCTQKGTLQPSPNVIQIFKQDKHFTVPYQFHLTKNKIPSTQQQQQQQQSKYFYQPIPIPKSLYQPQIKIKNQVPKTTVVKPFTFDGKVPQKITPEQYYHWDRTFKAKEVPPTTYQPQLSYDKEVNERLIKQKAMEKLKQATYPKTMEYLNNYQQYQNHKKQQWANKYQRGNSQIKVKEIPNFQKEHLNNLLKLEKLKQENKKQIKVNPFNFHSIKQRKHTSSLKFNYQQKQELVIQTIKTDIQRDKSHEIKYTKKYKQYVQFRKRENQKKLKQKQRQQNQKKQTQEKIKMKKILAERIRSEIREEEQQKKSRVIPSQPFIVEIDMEDLYKVKPLLMQGGKKEDKAYSSLYSPII